MGFCLKVLEESLASQFRLSCSAFPLPPTSEAKAGLEVKQMNLQS